MDPNLFNIILLCNILCVKLLTTHIYIYNIFKSPSWFVIFFDYYNIIIIVGW